MRLEERGVLGHPEFGRTVPCPECSGVTVAMGIPGIFTMASFQNFNVRLNPKMANAVSAVQSVAKGTVWGCLLTGDIGVGKTHLACAALRFNQLPKPGRFWQIGDMLRMFRDRMFSTDPEFRRDEDSLVKAYQTMPGLLVLDDIGAGTPDSQFTERVLYAIVNSRYLERLPTILTSNDTLDDRVFSRMRESIVVCEGEDRRGKVS